LVVGWVWEDGRSWVLGGCFPHSTLLRAGSFDVAQGRLLRRCSGQAPSTPLRVWMTYVTSPFPRLCPPRLRSGHASRAFLRPCSGHGRGRLGAGSSLKVEVRCCLVAGFSSLSVRGREEVCSLGIWPRLSTPFDCGCSPFDYARGIVLAVQATAICRRSNRAGPSRASGNRREAVGRLPPVPV
jgi:hypothetical protein